MGVVVIKPGVLDLEEVLAGKCWNCGCEFTCRRLDTTMSVFGPMVACPMRGCGAEVKAEAFAKYEAEKADHERRLARVKEYRREVAEIAQEESDAGFSL